MKKQVTPIRPHLIPTTVLGLFSCIFGALWLIGICLLGGADWLSWLMGVVFTLNGVAAVSSAVLNLCGKITPYDPSLIPHWERIVVKLLIGISYSFIGIALLTISLFIMKKL